VIPSARQRVFQGGTFQSLFFMMLLLTGVALGVTLTTLALNIRSRKKKYLAEKAHQNEDEMRAWKQGIQHQRTGPML
jgi:hypothetical protein